MAADGQLYSIVQTAGKAVRPLLIDEDVIAGHPKRER
jgi:hypothetical protein